jgi:hypothetical protein
MKKGDQPKLSTRCLVDIMSVGILGGSLKRTGGVTKKLFILINTYKRFCKKAKKRVVNVFGGSTIFYHLFEQPKSKKYQKKWSIKSFKRTFN